MFGIEAKIAGYAELAYTTFNYQAGNIQVTKGNDV